MNARLLTFDRADYRLTKVLMILVAVGAPVPYPAAVTTPHPQKRPGNGRVPQRRPFSHQERQHDQPLRTDRHVAGQVEQHAVGVAAGVVGEVDAEHIARPAHHDAAVADRAVVGWPKDKTDRAAATDRNGAAGQPQAGVTIVERAADYGIPASDIVVDPLVMPIGAMGTPGLQVFRLVRRLREELKVNTTCGASNISFGMPNRRVLTGYFLAMAASHGMTSAIMNPVRQVEMEAIRAANLGLSPTVEGQILRIRMPELNEQRRKDLVKIAHKYAEEGRVAIRHIRRDGLDILKKQLKDKAISEDDEKRHETEVQKATDAAISDVEQVLAQKEKEIMQV